MWVKPPIGILALIATSAVFVLGFFQWQTQKQQFADDERAWVSADTFGIAKPFTAQDRITFIAEIKNTGKTPAFIDGVDYSVASSAPNSSDRNWFFSAIADGGTIAPGNTQHIWMREPAPLGDAVFRLLESQQIVHHVRGTVRYHDAFGGNKITTFYVGFSGPLGDDKSLIPSEEPSIMK
jgi:hypothetical protein